MCGRYKVGPRALAGMQAVAGQAVPAHYAPQNPNNFQPGNACPVLVRGGANNVQINSMVWGLIPAWEKHQRNHFTMFNARSETAHEKVSFRQLLSSKRCVVVIDGYYEWQKVTASKKVPHFICLDRPLMIACLYDYNSTFEVTSFAMLTTESAGKLSAIHGRCPVVLPTQQDALAWLQVPSAGKNLGLPEILDQPSPLFSQELRFWPVTSAMGNPKYQGEDCSEPLKSPSSPQPLKKQTAIGNFFSSATSSPSPSAASSSMQKSAPVALPQPQPKPQPRVSAIAAALERQASQAAAF